MLPASLLAVVLLTAGCETTPSMPEPIIQDTGTITQPPPAIPATPEQSLDRDALDAVTDIALSNGTLAARIERNQRLSRGLDATTLALINARLAWLDGDLRGAQILLDEAATSNVEGRELILAERQKFAEARREWLAAARLAWQRWRLQLPNTGAARQEEIFSNLSQLSEQQLLRAELAARDPVWGGWIRLANAYRAGKPAVAAWIDQHADHPAIAAPPAALGEWLAQRPPATVAVLLPLSGRLQQAGEAVLEGIVEGLYQRYRDPADRPMLRALDTEAAADATIAYHQAVSAGADFVIGPLTRERVDMAARMQQRPVPQLALNRPDAPFSTAMRDWAALSLAPEDEAAQLADTAFGDGLRHALIIRPDTDWGRRMEMAVTARWRALGGTLVPTATTKSSDPASTVIGSALGATDSETRIRAIEDAFSAPVTARARRRADIDAVFLLAPDPATARELRPLLVFHYAGDVAVYSPSTVYSGNRQARNQDLNGLIFVETPEVMGAAQVNRFTRLRALGQDAIVVMDHWRQLQRSTTAPAFGRTGRLTRGTDGNVRRQLIPAFFDGDTIRQLPLR